MFKASMQQNRKKEKKFNEKRPRRRYEKSTCTTRGHSRIFLHLTYDNCDL